MNILVTGAAGYLGRGIVRQLLDDGHIVSAVDISVDNIDSRANRIASDIFSVYKPYESYGEPDVLLHLAWRNGFIHNDISHIEDLPLHYRFLKQMVTGGAGDRSRLSRIAVLGTMHEVGFFEGSIKGDTPTHPQSLYGIAKDALRNATLLLSKENKIPCQWIRGFYIVNNDSFGSSIFSKIVRAEAESQPFFPFTTGLNQWDFIDYDVFCEQVAAIIEQDDVTGIINACSGHPEKLAERVERFIAENNFKIRLDYGRFPDRPYDSKAVWGDDTSIKKIMSVRKIKLHDNHS